MLWSRLWMLTKRIGVWKCIKCIFIAFLVSFAGSWTKWNLFLTSSDLQCFDFSHEKLEKSLGEINPMVEFMPHGSSGSPYTLSHSSNYVTATPTPAETNPLQYLLQSLNKLPVVNAGIVDPSQPTMGAQRSLEKENEIRPSPVPKSTDGIRSGDPDSNYQVAMRHYEDVVNTLFQSFKARYKKSYISKREHETRKDIYRHNLRLEVPWLPCIRSLFAKAQWTKRTFSASETSQNVCEGRGARMELKQHVQTGTRVSTLIPLVTIRYDVIIWHVKVYYSHKKRKLMKLNWF